MVFFSALLVFLILALYFGVSWLICCGIVKILSLCFGFTFTWPVATGIWIVFMFVSAAFKGAGGGKS